MAKQTKNLTLREAAILNILSKGRNYGWGIRKQYNKFMSSPISGTSICVTLYRMEKYGIVKHLAKSSNPPNAHSRTYYRITAQGKQSLELFTENAKTLLTLIEQEK